jgi:CBS domain-containing protein
MKKVLKMLLKGVTVLSLAGVAFGAGYVVRGMKEEKLVRRPMKVYSDLRIVPFEEPGVVGIVDAGDVERYLKVSYSTPPFK